MGFSISWIAVQTDKHDAIFELLEVTPTTEEDEYFESQFSGSALHNGWFLLVGQDCDNRLVQKDILRELSKFGPSVACSVEEHVMYSSAEYWVSGVKQWSASHDAQKGMYNLETTGVLPESFENIKTTAFKDQAVEGGEQANVDLIFDIPLLLAAELVGFKHDEDCKSFAQSCPMVFNDKRRVAFDKKPWWKLW